MARAGMTDWQLMGVSVMIRKQTESITQDFCAMSLTYENQ
jgi:hypothetical protein